jgi:predicted NBD/HSP70 family sugar kinase
MTLTTLEEMTEGASQPGTPRLLRAFNERVLLEHLRQKGPMSRAQLARETRLSKPTVSQTLANLERAGLVRATGEVSVGHGGRQGALYESNPTVGYVVGIDIGRSWVRVAVADIASAIVVRRDSPNHARTAAALVELVVELAHNAVAEAGLTWSQVVHTVIGTPGVYDRTTGRLLFASNLPGWGRRGLVEMLQESLGPELTIDNDINLAALGERVFGSGVDVGTFVFLSVGTGVGLGIILNGTLYRGAHGAGGEIAFLPLNAGSPETYPASPRGILEEAASAGGVVKIAQELGMSPPLSPKQIFDAAREGDELALAVVEGEARHLAVTIASVAAILDPEMVVLGGGIGHNLDLLRTPLEYHLHELSPLRPRIVKSALGQDVILFGAIATGLEIARDRVFQRRAGA